MAESTPFLPNELDEKERGKLDFLFCSRSVSTATTHLISGPNTISALQMKGQQL